MSFENTSCACGDTKARETMLCIQCTDHLKGREEMEVFLNERERFESRRRAAIILLSLARKRKWSAFSRVVGGAR